MPLRSLLLTTAFVLSCPAFAGDDHKHDDDHGKSLSAHEHGGAELSIAVADGAVEMELEIPGASAVGFEHEAKTDEQRAAVADAKAKLDDALTLFAIPEGAGCTVASKEVELHQEGDHNAFEATYKLNCTNVRAIDAIGTTLFDAFAPLEEIDVKYATPAGQGAVELERGTNRIVLATS